MSVDSDWLEAQGEDAFLLHRVDAAFSVRDAPTRIGVAVSGGSDSMSVLHSFARVAKMKGQTVFAVTVDHGLRSEAKDEAAYVASVCADLGVAHETLRWERAQATGNIQDQARRARYALIREWAKRNEITHVVLGHTQDDQAETFLMRLARESGVDGLSGMRSSWRDGGVCFVRPFLGLWRGFLREYLTRNNIAWVNDPSNEDPTYDRVKARQVLEALKPLGIRAETLSAVAGHLETARSALEIHAMQVASTIMNKSGGDVVFWRRGFRLQSGEIQRRLLIKALLWVSSADYAPRSKAILELETAIAQLHDKTLSGCRIVVTDNQVRISRELRAVRDTVSDSHEIWDGRWQCEGPHAPDLEIRALTAEGLRECPDWRSTGMPRTSLISSPAIWRGETLVAAPIAGLRNGWSAQIVADFHSVPVAH